MNIRELLHNAVYDAMISAGLPEDSQPVIALAKNLQFGDYQSNGAMAAAKKAGKNPRELAQDILQHLEVDDIAEETSIAGPGFINIKLKPEFMAEQLTIASNDPRLGIQPTDEPQRVVVDYSAPNLATLRRVRSSG